MDLIRICIDRPVAVSVGVLLLVMFALLSLFSLPAQLTPNVDTPVMTVTTVWTGASPQEIEREIVDRQEEQLRSVKGLRQMTSQSLDNTGSWTLEFCPNGQGGGGPRAERQAAAGDRVSAGGGRPTIQVANADMKTTIAWLVLRRPSERPDDELPKAA